MPKMWQKEQNSEIAKLLKLSDVFYAVFINVSTCIFSERRKNNENSNVKEPLMTSETCQEQRKHSEYNKSNDWCMHMFKYVYFGWR